MTELTFVVPTYSRPELTYDCISSIATASSGIRMEVIVVENPSSNVCETSNLESIVGNLRHIIHDENLGPLRNWRFGVELARSEWVCLFFSDDLVRSVERKTFNQLRRSQSFLIARVDIVNERAEPIARDIYSKIGELSSPGLLKGSLSGAAGFPVSPACLIAKREDILSALNEFSDRFKFGWDNGAGPDLWVFLSLYEKYRGLEVSKPVPGFTVQFRAHSGSFSTNMDSNTKVSLNYLRTRIAFITDRFNFVASFFYLLRPFFNFGYSQPVFVLRSSFDFYKVIRGDVATPWVFVPCSLLGATVRFVNIIIRRLLERISPG